MTAPTDLDAAAVLREIRSVLLDFDGPVCSIFAGLPAPQVAEELSAILTTYGQPIPAGVDRNDPVDLTGTPVHAARSCCAWPSDT